MPSDKPIQEFTYEMYQNRQHEQITPDALRLGMKHIACGDKFRFVDGRWIPVPYPGIAVVSMVDMEPENAFLEVQLRQIQEMLRDELNHPAAYYMLPVKSFHQTMANTFSSHRYQRHVIDNGVEDTYPQMIGEAFEELPTPSIDDPIQLRLIGISIFRTAMGLLADFPDQRDFYRVMQFRDSFYGNNVLRKIGLRRTRPFVGHVTLAYIEKMLIDQEKAHLVDTIVQINSEIAGQELVFHIRHTEPRWYDDLSDFQQRQEYPSFSFVCSEGSELCETVY